MEQTINPTGETMTNDQFRANEELRAHTGSVLRRMSAMSRGDMLPHSAVEAMTGLHRNDPRYRYVMRKVERKMLLHGRRIQIWCFRDEGYKLLTVDEQLNMVPRKRDERAMRQVLGKQRALEGLLMEQGLSDHDRHVALARIEHARRQRSLIRAKSKAAKAILRPTPSIYAGQ